MEKPISKSSSRSRRAVFLDRDGVINRMVYNAEFGTIDSPANPDQLEILPYVSEAIAILNRLGLLVVVVSNQPGIAKGKFSFSLLEAMESKMHSLVAAHGGKIDGVYYCLHHPQAAVSELRIECNCRKPGPGLLLEAARERNIDLSGSYMVGDGITEIIAGHSAGTQAV